MIFLLGGCSEDGESNAGLRAQAVPAPEAFQEAAGTRERAIRLLDSLRRGALQEAFANLPNVGYTRQVRTEQLDPAGGVVAWEERLVRHPVGERPRIQRRDSSGTFDLGMLGRFAEAEAPSPPTDLAQQILSEEPAFLTERNRYAFQYRLLPDTSLAGGPASVVAVRARPGPDGEQQPLRHTRLYIDKDTRQLVALRLHRVRHSLLFDEETRQYVRLRPLTARDDTNTWVPAEMRFETRMDMPLRPSRRFRTTVSFSEYHAEAS